MLTWELPLPLSVAHWVGVGRTLDLEDGVKLFIPWHVLRGRQFNPTELNMQLAHDHAPEQFRKWMTDNPVKRHRADDEIGLQTKFIVFRVLSLVLERRYAKAIRHRLEKIDMALSEVTLQGDDRIHKIRQELTYCLRRSK